MLIYKITSVPDLTLNKYQAFSDAGISEMLDTQSQFIRQLHRVAVTGHIHIHFLYDYNPEEEAGKKLSIYLIFAGNNSDQNYYKKLRNIITASGLYQYFRFCEVNEHQLPKGSFDSMSTLCKKERILDTISDNKKWDFYVVPNWKLNRSGRMYQFFKLLESFDEKCCYRVDLYARAGFEDEIHSNFEKPLLFLRNISQHGLSISELSKQNRTGSDPNVEETLKQYEDWLKAVDSSEIFQCRISVFAENDLTGQFLLNSIVPESIEEGNVTIRSCSGSFGILSQADTIPEGYHLSTAPSTMKTWNTTYTSNEISLFCRLPVLYDAETIEIPKETDPPLLSDGLLLGKDTKDHAVRIPYSLLPKHMFVCGVPGAGKTNTMLLLADSLWRARIPFLVLEPAKKEYRELALFDIPELLLFSPNANTRFPLHINPFEFPIGLTLSEHINNLCATFKGAFPIPSPTPLVLDRAIQAVYENLGWDTDDINTGEKEYPCLSDLYRQFEIEMEKTDYDGEIKGNMKSVLELRIGSLLQREKKDIFDAKKSSLTPEEWLTRPVVIELEALGEGPANFLTLLLCTLIRETLKVNPMADRNKPVRHVIFIEEAHNLIASEAGGQKEDDSNPKIAATSYIVKMLAEVRALRESIIIADQLPTAMAEEVIKNTNIKLVHRLTAADDRGLIGGTMSATGLQMEYMATFTSGQALLTYEKLLKPFQLQVSQVEVHGSETPDDDALYKLMIQRPSYRKLLEKEHLLKTEILRQTLAEYIQTYTNLSDYIDLIRKKFFLEDSVTLEDLDHYVTFVNHSITESHRTRQSILRQLRRLDPYFSEDSYCSNVLTLLQDISYPELTDQLDELVQLYLIKREREKRVHEKN